MDFALSNEQKMIIDTTRSFVEQELYPYEAEVEKNNHIDSNLIEKIKQKSYFSKRILKSLLIYYRESRIKFIKRSNTKIDKKNSFTS